MIIDAIDAVNRELFAVSVVFMLIGGAMVVVAATCLLFGPRTNQLALEAIAH